MDIPNIPGLDFHPTDDELLTYYLKHRTLDYFQNQGSSVNSHTVPDIDLYNMHPKELPRQFRRLATVKSNGREWVFFCVRKEKYHNSSCSERTVPNVGYWKITSKSKEVKSEATRKVIGTKKILTFYEQSKHKGIKTDWILHEYHLNASCLGYNVGEMPYVVCRLHNKGSNHDESNGEDKTTGGATSASYTLAENTSEQDMWQSLPEIQQLPHHVSYHDAGNFTGRAEYFYNEEAGSSSGGFYNGNDSNFYYPSNDGSSYYQPYQGGWGWDSRYN